MIMRKAVFTKALASGIGTWRLALGLTAMSSPVQWVTFFPGDELQSLGPLRLPR